MQARSININFECGPEFEKGWARLICSYSGSAANLSKMSGKFKNAISVLRTYFEDVLITHVLILFLMKVNT